jgi:hypothetical protein
MTTPDPTADRFADIRARLDNAAVRDVPDEATDFELSRRRTAVLVLGAHAPADLAYLLGRVEELETQLATARRFIDERAQFIQVLRNYRGEDNSDYIRWTGHAEARRILAQSMGIELDKETGGIRKSAPEPTTAPDSEMDLFEAADDMDRRWE